jgi:hypothetical protein
MSSLKSAQRKLERSNGAGRHRRTSEWMPTTTSRLTKIGQLAHLDPPLAPATASIGMSIFDVLHILRALGDDLIVQRWRSAFRDKPFQKIIRRGTGVILLDAHSAPRREIQ